MLIFKGSQFKPSLLVTILFTSATSPKGNLGVTCNPNMAETFSKALASKIFLAPPPPSSSGWKTRTIVPYTKNQEWYITYP